MLLKDIIPKYIVLNKSYDDFAKDTEQIDYETEDFLSQVTDITSVLYTNSLESIWGFLGFIWDEYDVKGHFEATSMSFSIIPQIPDAHRLKEFPDNMFDKINSNTVELLDSNFQNVTKIGRIASTNKRFILHIESININNLNLNSEGFNGSGGDLTEEDIKKYAFGSVELYNKHFTTLYYQLIFSTFRQYYSSIIVTDDNKDYLLINKSGLVSNAIYYKENKPLNIYDIYRSENTSKDLINNLFISKQNKFIIGLTNFIGYSNRIYCFKIQDDTKPINTSTIENSINNIDNMLDVTVEFKIINKAINVGGRNINSIINTYNNIKALTYDYSNLDNIISDDKDICLSSLIPGNLVIIPELNNIDNFLNLDLDSIFKYIANGKLKSTTTLNIFFEDTSNFLFNYQIINLPKDVYKVIDCNHVEASIALEYEYIAYNSKTEAFKGYNNIKWINAENIIFKINTSSLDYHINENNELVYTRQSNYINYDWPIKCRGLWSNINLISRTDDYQIECNNIVCIYNNGPHISLNKYTTINDIPEFKPCVKLIINKEKRRCDNIFISNNIYEKHNNIEEGEDAMIEYFNQLGGIQLLELDNQINHQFNTDDDFKFCNFIFNSSGGNIIRYKNSTLIIKGPNYLIYNKAGENISHNSNNTRYIIIHKMQQFDMFYNAFIYVLTIQDDIHAFINAFINEELAEDRIGRVDIQIVHENFIQLTDDEKNKLINLGYNLIDVII